MSLPDGNFFRNERGAGTVTGVALVLFLLILLVAAMTLVRALNTRAILQAYSDQAALAAADAARGLAQGVPCELAAEIAENAGFQLSICKVEGVFATIVLETRVIGLSITGVSIAGPP